MQIIHGGFQQEQYQDRHSDFYQLQKWFLIFMKKITIDTVSRIRTNFESATSSLILLVSTYMFYDQVIHQISFKARLQITILTISNNLYSFSNVIMRDCFDVKNVIRFSKLTVTLKHIDKEVHKLKYLYGQEFRIRLIVKYN